MIHDLDNSSTLFSLHSSPYSFYLTGSRFFGHAKEDSDFDFFTLASPDCRDFLIKNGFKEVPLTYYSDSTIVKLFENGLNFHVQMVTDIEIKKTAQRIIYNLYKLRYVNLRVMSKVLASQLWTAVIEALK